MLTDTKPVAVTTDETTIRALIQAVEDGWNAGDGDAFAAPFAEDADYVIVNGRHIQGRPTIADGHWHLFRGIYKNSRNRANVHDVRFLRDDVAVVHIAWDLHIPMNPELAAEMGQRPNWRGDETEVNNRAYCTMVLAKENGRWHIAAFHNTTVQGR